MIAKGVLLAAFIGTGGYFGYKMANYDPSVVPYSKAQVQEMLADAKRTMPRKGGDGEIAIWGAGRTDKGVKLAMRYHDTAPQLDCAAVITELGPNESRVIADCNKGAKSAIQQTSDELDAPMFNEHIQATLHNREFNRSHVDNVQSGVVMKNLGGMQREALQTADTMQRMEADYSDSADYGSESVE